MAAPIRTAHKRRRSTVGQVLVIGLPQRLSSGMQSQSKLDAGGDVREAGKQKSEHFPYIELE